MTRRAKATQKNATATTQVFARPEDLDVLEARTIEYLMDGRSPKKADDLAAKDLRQGRLR